ncbi:hypothetical protein [Streptomyces sp. Tu 4128]|uniref:hypothetical protein n=1 Tax=Streptomyces sp. Tu 4128 TaxID=1120314 RepID=UPI001F12081F|nr:hypothetical protein [Streptomyces sp. Tu 4128]
MRKITSCGLITLAALAATTPAFATDGTNSGSGVNTANNWNFSAAAVCLQEIAVVPVLGDYTSVKPGEGMPFLDGRGSPRRRLASP